MSAHSYNAQLWDAWTKVVQMLTEACLSDAVGQKQTLTADWTFCSERERERERERESGMRKDTADQPSGQTAWQKNSGHTAELYQKLHKG